MRKPSHTGEDTGLPYYGISAANIAVEKMITPSTEKSKTKKKKYITEFKEKDKASHQKICS